MSHTTAGSTSGELSCALSPSEMLDRVVKWKALAAEALSRTSGPGSISSRYPRRDDIATRLEELIEAESDCCPFLEFTVKYEDDVIEAELRYPPEFEPMVATILPR